jgi:phosphatidate cytidylyltransferase
MAPIALGAVWLGDVAFLWLVAIAAGVMAHEWQRVTFGAASLWNAVFFVVAAGAAGAYAAQNPGELWNIVGLTVVMTAAGGFLLLFRGAPALWSGLGAVYVMLPCVAMIWLRAEPQHGLVAVFWLLFVVWATDIGAYFAGRTIGGPKLAPGISPNKTWAGLLGGMACAGLVGALMAQQTALASVTGLALVSVLLAVVAQAGDLAESAWKRHFGVKDSGSLIPGHGGILDRVDGLLFAAVGAAMMALVNKGKLLPWQ